MNNYLVRDAGHTQVEPGSVTVLGMGPDLNWKLDQITGSLKLLWINIIIIIVHLYWFQYHNSK